MSRFRPRRTTPANVNTNINTSGAKIGSASSFIDPTTNTTFIPATILVKLREELLINLQSTLADQSQQLARRGVSSSKLATAKTDIFVCVDTALLKLEKLSSTV